MDDKEVTFAEIRRLDLENQGAVPPRTTEITRQRHDAALKHAERMADLISDHRRMISEAKDSLQ